MDNNNNKREKIIIFILGAVLIIAVLSIIAIFSSAIMRLLGFEYESVGGFILYFIIASIVSYPMNLVAGAFPKALLNLDRITREMAVCMYALFRGALFVVPRPYPQGGGIILVAFPAGGKVAAHFLNEPFQPVRVFCLQLVVFGL